MKKIAVSLLLVFFVGSVNATIINNRTTFEASLGLSVTDDYENASYVLSQSNAVMSGVLGETQYTTTGYINHNLVFGSSGEQYYCAGCNGSFLLDFTSTSVGTSDGVFGVGFDYFNSISPLYHGFVTYGDGSTENFPFNQVGSSDLEFLGVTSDLLISSIHFGLINGGVTRSGSFGLNDLTIGSAEVNSVPEPASIALFGLGLAGIGFSRKKKAA